jgi:hypothetical protein
VPVYLNHPAGNGGQRTVQDKFAWIEGAAKVGADWRGNIHYNPKHPFAEQFAWLAKNKPSLIGLSHDAVGQGRTENGVFIVEKVISVKSVDLVADPATTKGLFESMDPELNGGGAGGEDLDSLETHITNAVAAVCKDDKLDLNAKMKKIKGALKILDGGADSGEVEEDDEEGEETPKKKDDGDVEESTKHKKPASGDKALREELDAVKAKLVAKDRSDLAAKLIAEAKLAPVYVTDTFLAQLTEAKDEKAMKALVEDRKQVASIQRPIAAGGVNRGGGSPMSTDDFAKKVKGR